MKLRVLNTKRVGKYLVMLAKDTTRARPLDGRRFWVIVKKRTTDRKPYGEPHKYAHKKGKTFATIEQAEAFMLKETDRLKLIIVGEKELGI